MLINMNEMLKVAKANKFGVPAFNIGNDIMFTTVIEKCEQTNSPVIVAIHPDELEYIGNEFALYVVERAKKATVPVVVHLDHGASLEQIVRAVKCGFTSVMIDASTSSLEQNIETSKQVVEVCAANNISVEGELGTIGTNAGAYESISDKIIYTQPADVKTYVEHTGVDTLAIAIGTAHGIYPENFVPELKLELLKEIVSTTDTFLVLHGGSNNKDEEIAEAVKIGVQKVNISSDYKSVLYETVRQYLAANPKEMEPHQIYKQAKLDAQAVLEHKLHLLDCYGKADLY